MSASCEVTQGVGGTWATCPTLLRGIWARGRMAGFHCCTRPAQPITPVRPWPYLSSDPTTRFSFKKLAHKIADRYLEAQQLLFAVIHQFTAHWV